MKALVYSLLMAHALSVMADTSGQFESKIVCDVDFGRITRSCEIKVLEEAEAPFPVKLSKGLSKKGYTVVNDNGSFTVRSMITGEEGPGYSDLRNRIVIKDSTGAKCVITSTTPNESGGKPFPAMAKEIWYGPKAIRAAINLIPECVR